MSDYYPSAYPTGGEDWSYEDLTSDTEASASPDTYDAQYPYPSGYPTPTSSYDYEYESPTDPTDIVYSKTPNAGYARYGVPTSADEPPEAAEPTSSSSSSIEVLPSSSVAIVPEETETSSESKLPTSTSEAIGSTSIQISTTSTKLSTTLTISRASHPTSILQSTTNATTQLPPSPDHSHSDRKTKLLLPTITPISSVLIILVIAAIFFLRRRRRRKGQSATAGEGGSNSEAETLGPENGSYLPFNGQNYDLMRPGSHDIPFDGPIPGKDAPLVRQASVHEVLTPPLQRSAPHSRTQSLRDGSSNNPLRVMNPSAESRPGTATGIEGRYLPLLETNLSAMENKETRPSIRTNTTNHSYSSANVTDAHNDAVSDISATSDGPRDANGPDLDLGDISPVSSIGETWDEAYAMQYTSGRAAHVRIDRNGSVSGPGDVPGIGAGNGNGGRSGHGSPH